MRLTLVAEHWNKVYPILTSSYYCYYAYVATAVFIRKNGGENMTVSFTRLKNRCRCQPDKETHNRRWCCCSHRQNQQGIQVGVVTDRIDLIYSAYCFSIVALAGDVDATAALPKCLLCRILGDLLSNIWNILYNLLKLRIIVFVTLEWAFSIYRGSGSSSICSNTMFLLLPRTGTPNTGSTEGLSRVSQFFESRGISFVAGCNLTTRCR